MKRLTKKYHKNVETLVMNGCPCYCRIVHVDDSEAGIRDAKFDW
ncbi:hypothetical protein PV797_04660 [Clostridiaceae bacterium M8S5]|nr:hypothetical protein PV797_04660 [Clostridiaceae bacterium M8S5]